jgi:hypothetical protein
MLRLSSGVSFFAFASVTSTASSITRFMNSSKPCSSSACTRDHIFRRSVTLSFPSMRMPRFSYSHTEMVARDCRSLKMKLIGGRRTAQVLVSFLRGAFVGSLVCTFSSTAACYKLAAVATKRRQYTCLHVQSFSREYYAEAVELGVVGSGGRVAVAEGGRR